MGRVINQIAFFLIVLGMSSCAVDSNNLDEDVASLYVGEWSYFDKQLYKDASSVTIERISNDEIKIFGFHNLGSGVYTKFRVSENDLKIISTVIDGLPIEGEGYSNYSYDEITILYSVDGDDFEAKMSKLD